MKCDNCYNEFCVNTGLKAFGKSRTWHLCPACTRIVLFILKDILRLGDENLAGILD